MRKLSQWRSSADKIRDSGVLKMPVVTELTFVPLGVGPSVSGYVAKVLKLLKTKGVKHVLTPSSTVFETKTREQAFKLIDELSEELFKEGVPRIVTIIKMDERRDKINWSMDYKVAVVKEKAEEKESDS